MSLLANKVVFVSGGSRGVGKEIAKKAGSLGAHVIITGKTAEPHPKLPGTLYTAAEEIEKAGAASCTPIICDVRDLASVKSAITEAGEKYGQIDILVNNASALYLKSIYDIEEKTFDLMNKVIVRSSYFNVKYALPYLLQSGIKQVLNIAPSVDLQDKWFAGPLGSHTAYTIAKYASSMMVTGLAAELKKDGISVNALWPATLLNTAAVEFVLGGDEALKRTRHPSIMADAAFEILLNKNVSGEYFLDDKVVSDMGKNPSDYNTVPGVTPTIDIYVNKEDVTL